MIAWLKKQLHQPWFGGAPGALLAMIACVVLFIFPLSNEPNEWSFAHDWSLDLPFLFKTERLLDSVAMVYLDEKSYDELKQDPARFDRALHGKLVRRLQQEGAKLVVFDILFIDPSRVITNVDLDFAAALKDSGRVVLAAQYYEDVHLGKAPSVVPPTDPFRDAAAGWGVARVHRDTDFAARLISPGTDRIPSLAWKAAQLSGLEIAQKPEQRIQERWLNFYCKEPFPGISYSEVVSGKPLRPGFSFKDKVVFVGSGEVAGFTGQEKEQFRYPWTWTTGHFPFGVEMHAVTYANYARKDWMTRVPTTVQIILLLLGGVLAGYGLCCLRPVAATGVALGSAVIVAALSIWMANQFHIWWSWLIFVAAQLPLALGWSYLFNSVRSYVETRILATSLELYLSPQQVKQILKTPALLKPGAEQKTVSILFSDIAGFSKISERMDPDDLVKLLNAYYETAIGCVHETGGTVMNLIGDAIFAIWNAPQEQEDHQARACRAAVLLNQALVKFESGSLNLPLNTRVGLHTGIVCVGNIGSSTRFEYTAIGESVNMAARLEGLNRQVGTNILATRDIQKTIGDKLVSRLVGHFKFKGFDQVVEIHEMVGLPESEPESRAWRQSFAAALSRYQRKAFAEAEEGFRKTLELRPNDGPSRFYLERIPALKVNAPASDWFGEVDLREK